MKKLFLQWFMLGHCLLLSAQSPYFEGTARYDLKYSGEAVAQFASMMPSAYTLKIKGNKSRFSIQGGMMASFMGDIISHIDKEIAYILMPQQKVAYKISTKDTEKPNSASNLVTKVVNTGETEKISGYECNKYKVIVKTDEGEAISHIWTSKEIAARFPRAAFQNNLPSMEGIEGFPVKIEQNLSQMGISFTMNIVLTELKEGKIADSEFAIPADYRVEEGLPNFGGMMKK